MQSVAVAPAGIVQVGLKREEIPAARQKFPERYGADAPIVIVEGWGGSWDEGAGR